ncbi:small membrane protein YniD [Yersinia enterocolitica]
MGTKRLHTKHWKMFVVLLCICGALMLLRWTSMIFG